MYIQTLALLTVKVNLVSKFEFGLAMDVSFWLENSDEQEKKKKKL